MNTIFSNVRCMAVALSMGMACAAFAQTLASPADRDAAARSAYARGDSAKASAALNEAVRLNPFDPVALNNLAVNYAATGDYQNAVALLERAQRIAPNRADIVNNLANLKAWMAQDSQFATGTRGVPQALNFPRAEDTPPELPPLWAGPPPTYQQPVGARPEQQNAYPASTAQQPAYPAGGVQYQQQPVAAARQTGGYASAQQPMAQPITNNPPPPIVTRSRPAPSAPMRPDSSIRTTAAANSTMITERASDYIPRKKKKRQVLDCPAP